MVCGLEWLGKVSDSRYIQIASDRSVVFIQHASELQPYRSSCTEISAQFRCCSRNSNLIVAHLHIHAILLIEFGKTRTFLFILPKDNGNKGIADLAFNAGLSNLIGLDCYLSGTDVIGLVCSKNGILSAFSCHRVGSSSQFDNIICKRTIVLDHTILRLNPYVEQVLGRLT